MQHVTIQNCCFASLSQIQTTVCCFEHKIADCWSLFIHYLFVEKCNIHVHVWYVVHVLLYYCRLEYIICSGDLAGFYIYHSHTYLVMCML